MKTLKEAVSTKSIVNEVNLVIIDLLKGNISYMELNGSAYIISKALSCGLSTTDFVHTFIAMSGESLGLSIDVDGVIGPSPQVLEILCILEEAGCRSMVDVDLVLKYHKDKYPGRHLKIARDLIFE